MDSISGKRLNEEKKAWEDYEDINENHKDILAENIEKGLENKAELTKEMHSLNA